MSLPIITRKRLPGMSMSSPLPRLASLALAWAVLGAPTAVVAQRPVELAPNAPQDRPVTTTEHCQYDALYRAIAPLVAQARSTYPEAKRRFETGLPPGQSFVVTVELLDSLSRREQVFVAVDSIVGDTIAGRIWSPVQVVRGYRYRQPYRFPESDLRDWLISRPDGSEEGNVVGKFLDTYQPPATCADSTG